MNMNYVFEVKNIRNAGAFDCAAVERYGITRKNEEEYKWN